MSFEEPVVRVSDVLPILNYLKTRLEINSDNASRFVRVESSVDNLEKIVTEGANGNDSVLTQLKLLRAHLVFSDLRAVELSKKVEAFDKKVDLLIKAQSNRKFNIIVAVISGLALILAAYVGAS